MGTKIIVILWYGVGLYARCTTKRITQEWEGSKGCVGMRLYNWGSLKNSIVKHVWLRLVMGWVTF